MKALKKVGKALMWTAAAVLVLLLVLPLWVGPVVKGVANGVVPGIVGTDFHLGDFGLNPYTGCARAGDMQLANPTNYSKENCIELGRLDVNVAMTSVFSKKLRIEEIDVDGLYIASTTGGGNFMQIAQNASGEEEDEVKQPKSETSSGKSGKSSSSSGKSAASDKKASSDAEEEEGGRVQIDKIRIKNLKLKIGMVTFPLPSMELEGIGADKEEGATFEDAWNAIATAVLKAAGAIGELGKSAVDAGAKAAGAAVDAVGSAAGATVEAGAKAAGAAVDAVGNAAGATVDAVGGAAGAAVDAVKGLFK